MAAAETRERVIVGFDGSDESRDALLLAKGFARAWDAELHVACVQWDDDSAAESQRFQRLFSEARRELGAQRFVERPLKDADAAAALSKLAEDIGASLVVLGSTHRGSIGRVLIGSTGERILDGAPCAVAVAPRGYQEREHFGFGLIGIGYDGAPESKLALQDAIRLAPRLDCSLRLVGVVPHAQPGGRITGTGPGYERVLAEDLTHRLEEARALVGGAVETAAVLEHGDPAEVLAGQGVELDLLVVGSRGYGPIRRAVLGAVSSELMRTSPCPVFVAPRGSEPVPA